MGYGEFCVCVCVWVVGRKQVCLPEHMIGLQRRVAHSWVETEKRDFSEPPRHILELRIHPLPHSLRAQVLQIAWLRAGREVSSGRRTWCFLKGRSSRQHSQEGLSADLVPEHLDITHLEASLCLLKPALKAGPHSLGDPFCKMVYTLYFRRKATLSSSPGKTDLLPEEPLQPPRHWPPLLLSF